MRQLSRFSQKTIFLLSSIALLPQVSIAQTPVEKGCQLMEKVDALPAIKK